MKGSDFEFDGVNLLYYDFPSTSKDWKKFELNNESIALNILYVPHKTTKIHLAYKSKHNLTRENQVRNSLNDY